MESSKDKNEQLLSPKNENKNINEEIKENSINKENSNNHKKMTTSKNMINENSGKTF